MSDGPFVEARNDQPADHHNIAEVLVGSLLSDPGRFAIVDGIITADDLPSQRLRYIYAAIAELYKTSINITPATVLGALEQMGVEHYTSLREIRNLGTVDIDIDQSQDIARQLSEDSKLRQAQDKIDALQAALNQPGISNAERFRMMSTAFDEISSQTHPTDTLMFADDVMDSVEDMFNNPYNATYTKTGLANFDLLTGGLRKRWTYVVAGRSGAFKSTWAHNVALNVLSNGVPCLIYSLEMDPEDYILRMAATNNQMFGIRELFRPELMEIEQRQQVIREIMPHFRKLPYGFMKSSISNMEVRPKTILRDALLFESKMKTRDYVIIVDYLGLMSGNKQHNGNTVNELGEISRNLKSIARVLDVPLIEVAQMNRGIENRKEGDEPELHDLAGSDAIARDADFVMFLRRNEEEQNQVRGFVKKHRNGKLATLVWDVQAEHGRFNPISF